MLTISEDAHCTVLSIFGILRELPAPLYRLVQSSDGDFYGTTLNGGTGGAVAVFQITPSGAHTSSCTLSLAEPKGLIPMLELLTAPGGPTPLT